MTTNSPKVKTFDEVVPMIYSWTTPNVIPTGHTASLEADGWEKIGYTEQASVDVRIAQQASQMGSFVEKRKLWAYEARFIAERGGWFRDTDFHKYLHQQGIERFVDQGKTEWHRFAGMPKTSKEYFLSFVAQDFAPAQTVAPQEYTLRREQRAAVDQALTAFGPTVAGNEALWNAKPRFGKTLTTYDLMRKMDVRRALIVTNRPAIANSWFDDFEKFVAHKTTYQFVSDSPSLDQRNPMTRDQWRAYSKDLDRDPRIIEFVSLQDLKGSLYFGGSFDKLKEIAVGEWDLLVIDEAHEGVDTTKTDVAFDKIKRSHTLYLSGTPFKALAKGRFAQDQIFNWTYQDEQTAKAKWSDEAQDNPYAELPTLNLLTYQLSRMVTDRLSEGVALDEESGNVDYTFDLAEFFATKDNGYFVHEPDVERFLDALTTQEKYPFSTPELRDEVRHSFWLLNRVAAAKALERLLKAHPVFSEYTVILAAGDGRPSTDDGDGLDEDADDSVTTGRSLDKVRAAIKNAEAEGGKTITLSVGQLTTGVTVPEWTAVIMLSNLSSPSLYMQAAFRAQNPHTFTRGDKVFAKSNAYIFDFAPERTLTIFDQFANDLAPRLPVDGAERHANIRRLLNFFPILGEDTEGRMIELDAEKVLTFPQVFKAREVVRRGFLSNLLFANVSGIFRAAQHFEDILNKLPAAKERRTENGKPVGVPVPPPITDDDGNVKVDFETVINPKVAAIGKPIHSDGDVPVLDPASVKAGQAAKQIAAVVNEKARETRDKLKAEYGLTDKQVTADEKATEAQVTAKLERAYIDHKIALNHIEAEAREAPTEASFEALEAKKVAAKADLDAQVLAIYHDTLDNITETVVKREETKKAQADVNKTLDAARDHLRGFARTIPMFLMAYGDRDIRLANFDDYTPDDVFAEITGITEEDFRTLRDGRDVTDPHSGEVTPVPGLFDEAVFDQAMQAFLDKKEALADYFDDAQTEDIFAYIPQQKTSLVFTPKAVVTKMVDVLEAENPGIFLDPNKTFADLFSTAGLFLMEIVRRLDTGLAAVMPDQDERLRHILSSQVYEMSHNKLLHRITVEAVSGGVEERKAWIEGSGHFRVGNLAHMTPVVRNETIAEMLGDS